MQIISVVFHPLLMTTYMSVILSCYVPEAFSPYSASIVPKLVLSIFFLTTLFPLMSIILLKLLTPLISDLKLSTRKERLLPFIIVIILYIGTSKWLIIDLQLSEIIRILLFLATGMIGLMCLINLKFKISTHSAAMWAIAGYALSMAIKLSLPELKSVIFIAVIIGGLVSTSRLYLGYHRPLEVWTGSIVGGGYSFLMVYILF